MLAYDVVSPEHRGVFRQRGACSMNLVVLVAVVVEDLADQRAPHQLGVSVFDLKQTGCASG